MTAAVIIAAGRTSRKERFSPEKQIGKVTAIERIALLFQLAGIRKIVVIGDEEELPQKLLSDMNVTFLTASAGGEMLDSIKKALYYLQDKCANVLISTADVPLFSKQTVQLLLAEDAPVCIPSYQGRCGHPILLRADCFSRVLSHQGSGGLKGAIEAAEIPRKIIETDDPGIRADSRDDTVCESLLADHDLMKMWVSCKTRIHREKGFYGPGAHQLLQLTEEFGSLSQACQHMGISYSKGRKIIATLEDQLGVPILETRQGGKAGGFSRLTHAAVEMMRRYSAFREEAEAAVQEIFLKHFHEV